jgi:hypothetical protein
MGYLTIVGESMFPKSQVRLDFSFTDSTTSQRKIGTKE